MKLLAVVGLTLMGAFSGTAQAQIGLGGSSGSVNVPGNVDGLGRMAGFSNGGKYYLVYGNRAASNLLYPVTPTVSWGTYESIPGFPAPAAGLQFASPAAGASLTIPNVPVDANVLNLATATVQDARYLFEFKCTNAGGGNKLLGAYYQKLQMPTAANPSPQFVNTGTVNASMINSFGSLYDVAAGGLNGKMYMFMLSGTGGNNTIKVWSYNGNTTTGPIDETANYNFLGTGAGIYFTSIDATDVTLQSGEQGILVSAVYYNAGVSQVQLYLFSGGGTASSPVTLVPWTTANSPATNNTLSPSIRVVNGLGIGSTIANAVTIFYAETNFYNGNESVTLYNGEIELPPSLSSNNFSQVGGNNGWTQSASFYLNTQNRNHSQFPRGWTAFTSTIPFGPTNNGFSNVAKYLTLFQKGTSNSSNNDYFVSSLGEELLLAPNGTSTNSWDSSNAISFDTADQLAAVQSWTLLGVITGLPPVPKGQTMPPTLPLFSLSYASSGTSNLQTKKATVVSVGTSITTPILNGSASFTSEAKVGDFNSNTVSLQLGQTYSVGGDGTFSEDDDLGFLVVSEPVYFTGQYNVYGWDGATPIGLSTETISISGQSTLDFVPFSLTHPNVPPAEYAGEYPASIYSSFPTNAAGAPLVTYPRMSNIEGWKTPMALSDTKPLFSSAGVTIKGTNVSSPKVSLFQGTSAGFSQSTSSKVGVGAGISFLGIGVSGSHSVEFDSQISSAFSTDSTTSVQYPMLDPAVEPYNLIKINAQFLTVADLPGQTPNWMPTVFAGSHPWVLTWQVGQTGLAPTSGNGSTGGGTGGGHSCGGKSGGPGKDCPPPKITPPPKESEGGALNWVQQIFATIFYTLFGGK